MPDYEPLSLTRACNVTARFHPRPGGPWLGRRTFHGLPFQIGPVRTRGAATRCFIGFDERAAADQAVTVPIRRTARHLIFAHALLSTRIYEGGPVGETVAHYVIRYADGSEQRLPLRERFEVSAAQTWWGQWPFVARPDQADRMWTRKTGKFADAGPRQTEAMPGGSHSYYLWAWRNPHPRRKIESLTVEPAGRRFLLAAVTLSHLDEPPFSRQTMREVMVTLPRRKDADQPFDLEVSVDRGLANYTYALPAESSKAFLDDPQHPGWGQKQNDKSSPAYVGIAANPSATVTVRSQGKSLARVNWGRLQQRKKVAGPRATLQLLDRGRNWVHTTVVDDQTGRPIPCRVHFRSPEGVPYQPHGHHDHVNSNLGTWHTDIGGDVRLGQITYAYIDGTCQGWLPRGDVIVDVARGYEYEPLRSRVRIEPGQRSLTLRLKRFADMNARRWFSGDSHVHFLGGQGAHREAAGEDLNVVNLLQSQWGHLFTNVEDFIGRPVASDDGRTIVYCSQENRQHILGHLTLWGLKHPVYPMGSGGPGEAELGGNLETTLSRWADACHAQGGTVVIPHLPNPNGEPAALIATGRADAVEMLIQGDYQNLEYYRYLNCGYRLPLVGGTDKMTADVPVGLYRTYAWIPPDEPFDYDAWTRAVRAGRTFLSGGPLIDFTVGGAMIGDTLNLPGDGGTLEVAARADSILPIHSLEIVHNGRVVASTESRAGSRHLHLDAKVKVDRHGWLAARCGGPVAGFTRHHDGWQRGIFAHTSPVYVAVGGDWWMFDAATAEYMLTLIHGSVQHIRHGSRHHEPRATTHHHHHHDHIEWLEEPFRQAIDAIHRRMHQLGIPH